VLANLFRERGVGLDRTYQLNFGGNTDFQNMLERERLESKKISKTQSVASQLDIPCPPTTSTSARATSSPGSRTESSPISHGGHHFGNVPLNLELKLEVWDSPNSAGIVVDAVRCAKLALDRGIAGALTGPSSYFMKSPPEQFTDAEARERHAALHRRRGLAAIRGMTTLFLVRHAAHDLLGRVLTGRMPGVRLASKDVASRTRSRPVFPAKP
jgi:myo-inositol-1-phosphate synthase